MCVWGMCVCIGCGLGVDVGVGVCVGCVYLCVGRQSLYGNLPYSASSASMIKEIELLH